MAHIEYSAVSPEYSELLNSEEFYSVLEAHPNLRLVTVEEDESDKEIFNELTLPFLDQDICVAVMDSTDDDAFMWVLNDDYDEVVDPSPAFIAVLRVMDNFLTDTVGERLFVPRNQDLYTDSPEVFTAEFDFIKGEYVI